MSGTSKKEGGGKPAAPPKDIRPADRALISQRQGRGSYQTKG